MIMVMPTIMIIAMAMMTGPLTTPIDERRHHGDCGRQLGSPCSTTISTVAELVIMMIVLVLEQQDEALHRAYPAAIVVVVDASTSALVVMSCLPPAAASR
jgi:hypothetical protein